MAVRYREAGSRNSGLAEANALYHQRDAVVYGAPLGQHAMLRNYMPTLESKRR